MRFAPSFGLIAVFVAAFFAASSAPALEYPIGAPQQRYGMEIPAVYLQPLTMEPEGIMKAPSESDLHLEADIQALANNPNGFAEGAWIPYLKVQFELKKEGSADTVSGELMPMVANDGAHYGDNVKLKGPGKDKLKYRIHPTSADPRNH